VTTARLRDALAAWASADPSHAPHARALGELFEEHRRALASLGPVASLARRVARALDALRRAPSLWGATPVLLYGFDDFTSLQLDAIVTLGTVVATRLTVSLSYEPSREAFASRGATFQSLLAVAAEHRRLGPRVEYYAPGARAALHHLERHLFEPFPPPPLEAAGAVRLLEGGGERAEFELVAKEICGLLASGVAPAEIAVAHRSPARIAPLLSEVFRARAIPFALQRPLLFAHTATGRALLGLLNATFADDGEADGGDGAGLGDLLAWLRAPGVLRRPELADELELRALRSGVRAATGARALWEAAHWPLDSLDRLREAAERSPAALIERTLQELSRLQYAPHAEIETRAAAAAAEALGEFGELARRAPELAPDAPDLIALLREVELVVGGKPSVASDMVTVLDPLALRARRVRALFLCGLQEGVFPAPAPPEPYLSEEERVALARASGLRVGRPSDALARERYLLYAAVSRPWELLVLSWHTSDDDGLPTPRSLFVEDVCDLFTDELHRKTSSPGAVEAGKNGTALQPQPIAPLGDPHVLAELGGQRLWSASSLQSWAGCPVQWFVERMLGARDLEPEAEPLARGGLAHAALRATFARLRAETGSARLSLERLPRARELLHAALEEQVGERPLSTAPERVPGLRRRLEADLERYLEHAAASAVFSLEPAHLELPFGFCDEADGLPALDLGDGVMLRGYIDRIDLTQAGEAVVYDYKGAFVTPPDRWLAERSFQVALYMRAAERLPDVRVVGGFYQPLSGRDLRARGVLAEEGSLALECVRGDVRPAAEVRELLEEIVDAARAAAAEARAGELQPRPATCGFGGGGCAYPSICRCDR
jgi:PD-(D/E)XK nuclease superfamily